MKVLFYDLETTDLKGLMGRILCGSFVGLEGKPKTFRLDKYPGKSKIDDSKLALALRNELEEANLIVGWNSKLFDLPMLNAKLAKAGHRRTFVQFHLDLMWFAGGSSMRIGSRKLDNVAKYFNLPHQKTPLDWETWQVAGTGDRKALNYVVEHCEADVCVLREAYHYLLPYVANLHR